MANSNEDPFERGLEYVVLRGAELVLASRLGTGVHGSVFVCRHKERPTPTAVKIHDRMSSYVRERDVYLRLRELGMTSVRGHHVPILLDYDDALFVIEMTIVTRPFVLDFGGAYLDQPPDFSPEVLSDWHREKEEQFETRWPEVQAILGALQQTGIFVADVNTDNIAFCEDPQAEP